MIFRVFLASTADGTITYSIKDGYPQLTISVTNKLLVDVINFKNIFLAGLRKLGNIYFDKGQNGYYKWSLLAGKTSKKGYK